MMSDTDRPHVYPCGLDPYWARLEGDKRMTYRRPAALRAMALVGVAALGLVACSSSGKTSTGSGTTAAGGGGGGGTTVKIGFFGALTGPNAQLGINIHDGAILAIQQYNASNPAVKVTLDSFDSQGDPAQANNGATKLINDKVVAVIGPAFSGESTAADPIFESAQIPNVTASATKVALAQSGWHFFHRALADDSRRTMLDTLVDGPATAGELAALLPIARPGVSRHLRVLREAGLVEVRREAQRRIYALRAEPLSEVDAWLDRYRAVWGQRLDALHTEVARQKRERRSTT